MTTQVQEIVLSEKDLARRKAIVYLKGFIIGYSVANGMKWSSKIPPSPVFLSGQKDGENARWNKTLVNGVHVFYNRIRHNRPHGSSFESDSAMLESSEYSLKEIYEKLGVTKETKENLYANEDVRVG